MRRVIFNCFIKLSIHQIKMKKFSGLVVLFLLICIAGYSQPANDDCTNATPISLPSNGGACVTGTTVGGTATNWTTAVCGQTVWGSDVWYTFVSTGTNNVVTVRPTGAPAATQLGVSIYSGSCASPVGAPGSCAVSATNGGSDTAIYPAPVGTVLYVEVNSFGTAGGFQLCVTSSTPPAAPGNTCATAARLCTEAPFTVATIPLGGSSFTPSCFGPNTPTDGQWYQFTVGVTGQLAWKCTPTVANIELDWALYNITNGCPTNASSANYQTCNFNYSGETSNPIGMSQASNTVCPDSSLSFLANKEICPWETVIAGQTYAIFINNYSYPTTTGWNFNFTGSTFQMAPVDTFLVSPDTICGNTGTVTLTNNSVADIWQQWNFGDGNTSLAVNPGTHTYSSPGTYFISLKDSSQSGCVAVASKSVLISPYPVITVHSDTICPGGSATLTASPSVPGGTYLWSNGATTASITASPASTTSYTVTYSSPVGCTATATATIMVNSNPTASITATPPSICPGQSSALVASAGASYLWSTGATSASITVIPVGTTTYTITVTLVGGCTASATTTVTVSNNATASITPTPASVCPGQSSVLASSPGNAFIWSTGATTASITVTPAATSNYNVTVTVSGTCTATATTTITVLPNPTASITPNPASICPGQSSTLTANAGSGYLWSNGATTNAITVSPITTTPYNVTVTIGGACTTTATSTITVFTNPVASVNPVATSICPGQNATLTAGGGTLYLWSTAATTAAITVTPAATTTYTVTVANANNCTATASGTVTVGNSTVATITPNPSTICLGTNASLTAGGPAPYLWSDGSTTGTITPSPVSNTVYTLTVGNGTNCSATTSTNVTVDNFTATITPATSNICIGQTSTLNCTAGVTYSWSDGTTTNQGDVVAPTTTTTYTVTVTDANSCSATATAVVNVDVPALVITPASASICSGQTTTLVASGASTYSWSNGNFTASNTVTPALTHTYVVTATDAQGCTVTDSATVTIGITPVATFTVTSPVCVGQNATVTFTGTASATAVYNWGFGGGTVVSGSGKGPYQLNWSSAGTDMLSLVINDNGCNSTPDSVPVTINAIPVSFAGNDTTYCSENSVDLGTASITGYTYLWSPATGLSSATASNPTLNLTNAANSVLTQTYTVTTSNNGCTSTDAVNVTVDPVPVAEFNDHAPQCLPTNSFNFTAQGSFLPSATFAWTFGPNATPLTSTTQNQTVTYSAAQTAGVSLTITQLGCVSNTYTDSVIINPVPVSGFKPDTTKGCPGQVVCFTNNSTSVGVTTYQWNFGDGNTSTNLAPCHTYTAAGTYSVSLNVTANHCSNDSISLDLISIIPGPTAKFTPSATVIQQPLSEVDFTNQSLNALTYLWNFGTASTSTDINPVVNFMQYGLYNVVLNAYNALGCVDSTEIPISVLPPQNFFIPNVFTPNNDGNNDNFYIEMQEGVTVIEFTVFDRWGEKVHDGQYPWDGNYKGKPCPEGVYVYLFKLQLAANQVGIKRTGSITLMR